MIPSWLLWSSSCTDPLCLAPSHFHLCLCHGLDHGFMPPPLMVLPLLLFFLCHCPPPLGHQSLCHLGPTRQLRPPASDAQPGIYLPGGSTIPAAIDPAGWLHASRPSPWAQATCALCYLFFLLSAKQQAVHYVPSQFTPVPEGLVGLQAKPVPTCRALWLGQTAFLLCLWLTHVLTLPHSQSLCPFPQESNPSTQIKSCTPRCQWRINWATSANLLVGVCWCKWVSNL